MRSLSPQSACDHTTASPPRKVGRSFGQLGVYNDNEQITARLIVTTHRLHVLLGIALIAAAGCAGQPQRHDHEAAAAASSGTVAPAASPLAAASIRSMKSSVPPDLLVFAHDAGFRQVIIKGNDYYFCKTEDPMGSIIPVRRCLDQSQLASLRQQVQQQQEQFHRPAANNVGQPP